jgi:hypothetical protein
MLNRTAEFWRPNRGIKRPNSGIAAESVDCPAVVASRRAHVVGNDGDAERVSKSMKIVDPD